MYGYHGRNKKEETIFLGSSYLQLNKVFLQTNLERNSLNSSYISILSVNFENLTVRLHVLLESFGWILQKIKFICDIYTVQTYLGKWQEKRISAIVLPKFWEKVGERREDRGERNDVTDVGERKRNFSNDIAEKKNFMAIELLKLKDEKKKTELWQK